MKAYLSLTQTLKFGLIQVQDLEPFSRTYLAAKSIEEYVLSKL